MKRVGKVLAWLLATPLVLTIIAYNTFVQVRYKELPSDRSPTAIKYQDRIQKIFWDVEFGGDSMTIHPMPFWKWFWGFGKSVYTQGSDNPSFKAASDAGRAMLFRKEYSKRHLEFQLDWLFASIWISKNWTAQDVVNTILAEAYFGYDIHGLNQAARAYFGVKPDELSNEEMVFLSGLTRRPAATNPWAKPDEARKLAGALLQRAAKVGIVVEGTDPELCFKRLQEKPSFKQLPQN
jgi:hypothetical protein